MPAKGNACDGRNLVPELPKLFGRRRVEFGIFEYRDEGAVLKPCDD